MPKVDNWEDWDEVEEKTNDEIVRNKITFKNNIEIKFKTIKRLLYSNKIFTIC